MSVMLSANQNLAPLPDACIKNNILTTPHYQVWSKFFLRGQHNTVASTTTNTTVSIVAIDRSFVRSFKAALVLALLVVYQCVTVGLS